MTMRLLSSFLVAAALAACTSNGPETRDASANQTAAAAVTLDVNDVSLLFPLPTRRADLAQLLSINAQGAGGPLLSDANFRALVGFETPSDDPTFKANDPKAWKVVGVRVDPCAQTAPGAACQPQLRLITQPVTFEGGRAGTLDHAIHLVYNLTPDAFSSLAADLVALKQAAGASTNGAPLGVHPAMRAEGLGGPFAKGLKQLIGKHAGPANLAGAAVMLTLNAGEWRFAISAARDGALVQLQPPCADASRRTISMRGTTGFVGNFIDRVEPPATCADNVNEIILSNPGPGGGAFLQKSAAEQQPFVDAALRVDNPRTHTAFTTDCVSCHVASRSLARVKGEAFLSAFDDGNANRFVPAAGVTMTFASGRLDPADASPASDPIGPYNVRSFGYQDELPSYTARALNETAFVVEQMNAALAGGAP
jgi:hypothetical protein